MADIENHTLVLLRRLDEKIDALADDLAQVKATMATKTELLQVWHALEGQLELLRLDGRARSELEEQRHAGLERRLAVLEVEVRRLKERAPV